MEERKYSKIEIVNALNQLKLSNLEKSLFEHLDSNTINSNEKFPYTNGGEIYLKGKSGKTFNRVESNPENSYFKLIDGNQFIFEGSAEEAIARRIFHDDICDIVSGGYLTGNYVKTIKPGKIKYNSDDKWEVTERIQVALEK